MRVVCVLVCFLGWCLHDPAQLMAHSAEGVAKAFDRGSHSRGTTEGHQGPRGHCRQKSSREEAHERQHKLLDNMSRRGRSGGAGKPWPI